MKNDQKQFLNGLFDEGEQTGKKLTGEKAWELLRGKFDADDVLPVQTIRGYFSRRRHTKDLSHEDDEKTDAGDDLAIEDDDYWNEEEDNAVNEACHQAVQIIRHNINTVKTFFLHFG